MNPDSFKKYLEEARSWDLDITARACQSERRAWLVAGGSMACALAAIGALVALTPLKSVEPYVIRVDQATGVVDVATAFKDDASTYDEAVSKYFLAQYVRLRESYAPDLLPHAYKSIGLMSAGDVRQSWGEINQSTDPRNPQKRYGKFGRAETKIKAIQFLGPKIAAVRFSLSQKTAAETSNKLTHWIATITFSFVNEPTSEEDRLINPLGFQVTDYRLDPEVQ